ncbi:hypothetical protein AYO40_02550 [Planctomycetaceae bacterium SCGC AG-212-D15]|nr:hypothetical protein AYO40_02550 [Planctomycetaceae bacterium SCGC AG-212-D15]
MILFPPVWTPSGIVKALPLLRPLIADVREAWCRLSHLRLVARRNPRDREAENAAEEASRKVAELLREVVKLGIVFFTDFHRGIVLCASMVSRRDRKDRIYFVYRDSSDEPEAWVTHADLFDAGDLEGCEQPIPPAWWRVKMPKRKGKK